MSGRQPYPKGVAKKEEILRCAFERFANEGEKGVSLRTVAQDSGLSLAGLRHYFESKDHLLIEMLRARDRSAEQRFDTAGSALDLGEFMAEAMAANALDPARSRLYVMLSAAAMDPNHPAHQYFRQRFQLFKDFAIRHLVHGQENGTIPQATDPEFAAMALLAATDGIQIQWLIDPDIDMADHIRTVWRKLITPAQRCA
ncbi:TetR/AcrR family transcriptional regulator [Rhodococcus qingshengii]|uniref:TetR/AcrR family transcriptional regulator n=1 Tax=Rhodococcus qingshengii TaxID=334542 RepID=UPI0010A5B2DD|nr:TetR/AcrR family transcriptional regulator [Rhodococcus qingshengii]THJ66351.1 TetR/AcrR family transcriptional regulator [Rhodococcus qingshengii]